MLNDIKCFYKGESDTNYCHQYKKCGAPQNYKCSFELLKPQNKLTWLFCWREWVLFFPHGEVEFAIIMCNTNYLH